MIREKQYLSHMYIMHANALYNTPLNTQITSYMVWKVHLLGVITSSNGKWKRIVYIIKTYIFLDLYFVYVMESFIILNLKPWYIYMGLFSTLS